MPSDWHLFKTIGTWEKTDLLWLGRRSIRMTFKSALGGLPVRAIRVLAFKNSEVGRSSHTTFLFYI